MLQDLLPAGAIGVEAYDDPPGAELFPAEAAVVARAVERRRREFATVRACARAALARLGLPPVAIVPGPGGAPRWPAGVLGSLTHCAGYRGAAVARAADLLCLGIDAEPHEPLPAEVADGGLILSDGEREAVRALAGSHPDVHWDRLLFCAKEAVYKAWYPMTGRWLDFTDVTVTAAPDGRFGADLLVAGPVLDGRPVRAFPGRWLAARGLVLAVVALPRSGQETPPRNGQVIRNA